MLARFTYFQLANCPPFQGWLLFAALWLASYLPLFYFFFISHVVTSTLALVLGIGSLIDICRNFGWLDIFRAKTRPAHWRIHQYGLVCFPHCHEFPISIACSSPRMASRVWLSPLRHYPELLSTLT